MANDTLTIDVPRLERIIDAPITRAAPGERQPGRRGRGGSYVTAEVLAETATPACRCHELGLVVGMPVADLLSLDSGCTGVDSPLSVGGGGWVCERLDKVRRRYGR